MFSDSKVAEMVRSGAPWIRVYETGQVSSRGKTETVKAKISDIVDQVVRGGYVSWTIGNGMARVHLCRKEA